MLINQDVFIHPTAAAAVVAHGKCRRRLQRDPAGGTDRRPHKAATGWWTQLPLEEGRDRRESCLGRRAGEMLLLQAKLSRAEPSRVKLTASSTSLLWGVKTLRITL